MKKIVLVVLAVLFLAGCTTARAAETNKLWDGEWNSGSIAVNDGNYTVFKFDAEYGSFIACKNGDYIEGGNFYGFNAENTLVSYAVKIKVDGNTWTIDTARYAIMKDGEQLEVKDSDMKIIAIYGLL